SLHPWRLFGGAAGSCPRPRRFGCAARWHAVLRRGSLLDRRLCDLPRRLFDGSRRRERRRGNASGRCSFVVARQIVSSLEPGDAARRKYVVRRRKQGRIVERGRVDGDRRWSLLLAVDDEAAACRTELALAPGRGAKDAG